MRYLFPQQRKLGVFSHSKGPGAAKIPLRQSPGSQEQVPKQGSRGSRFLGRGSQARFPGRGSQARFPGRGSQARFPSQVRKGSQEEEEVAKVPRNRFPSKGSWAKVPKQKFQEKFSIKVSKNRFPSKLSRNMFPQQRKLRSGFPKFRLLPKQGSKARFPSKVSKQVSQSSERFPETIAKQGSQARFPRSSGRSSEARFPGTGFERFPKVPKNRFPSKVPKSRFPSKVVGGSQEQIPKQGSQGSQEEVPTQGSQARFSGTGSHAKEQVPKPGS